MKKSGNSSTFWKKWIGLKNSWNFVLAQGRIHCLSSAKTTRPSWVARNRVVWPCDRGNSSSTPLRCPRLHKRRPRAGTSRETLHVIRLLENSAKTGTGWDEWGRVSARQQSVSHPQLQQCGCGSEVNIHTTTSARVDITTSVSPRVLLACRSAAVNMRWVPMSLANITLDAKGFRTLPGWFSRELGL